MRYRQPSPDGDDLDMDFEDETDILLRNPGCVPSSEAAHRALMFANIAGNETVGFVYGRNGYHLARELIEAENPQC